MEIIIAIAIIGVIAGISLVAFSSKLRSAAVEKEAETALSYITKARNQAVSSEDNSSYGIHVSSTTLSYFKGSSFASGDDIITYEFRDTRAEVELGDDADELYFERRTGTPSEVGSITLVSKRDASSTKRIIIQGTGLAEIE